MATLPHAVVYIEGGYSDSNTPPYAARILNAADISRVRGFFTNDTHINWTINEIKDEDAISRLTGGSHFIVNTAQNGNGPKLNPHPTTQGVEDLCNPPGRALGHVPPPQPATRWLTRSCGRTSPATAAAAVTVGQEAEHSGPHEQSHSPPTQTAVLGPNFPSQTY